LSSLWISSFLRGFWRTAVVPFLDLVRRVARETPGRRLSDQSIQIWLSSSRLQSGFASTMTSVVPRRPEKGRHHSNGVFSGAAPRVRKPLDMSLTDRITKTARQLGGWVKP